MLVLITPPGEAKYFIGPMEKRGGDAFAIPEALYAAGFIFQIEKPTVDMPSRVIV